VCTFSCEMSMGGLIKVEVSYRGHFSLDYAAHLAQVKTVRLIP